LIHSFSREFAGWENYQDFTRLFEVEAEPGIIQRLNADSGIPLFTVWVSGNSA